jgi:hypothetical protein
MQLQFNFRKLLEFAILGQFVFKQVMSEVKSQAGDSCNVMPAVSPVTCPIRVSSGRATSE